MKKSLLLLALIGGVCLLNACGGNNGNTPALRVATHFAVTAPASADTGSVFSFTVTALDDTNNVATGYSGTVRFTSTDGKAVLPGNTALAGGMGMFSATLETTGPQTITVTDMAKTMITGATSISVSSATALAITSGQPPDGTVGVIYGTLRSGCSYHDSHIVFGLTANGGKQPYFWSGSSQAPGLNVTYQGFASLPPLCQGFTIPVIEGTPTAAGSYNVTVTVTDSGSPATQVTASYAITVNATQAPAINTAPPPSSGAANRPYSFTFTATGGVPPHVWSQMGVVPPGLAFDDRGVLSGTPKATGSFPITINVQDSAGRSAIPQEFKIRVFLRGFGPTAKLEAARAWHAVTLLKDGKLLVTGGRDANGKTISAAEIYDPTARNFLEAGNLGIACAEHTATLLKDGAVLVNGGIDANGNALTTAELYDPATRSFSRTESMAFARFGHTATLLKDGKVLVAGGSDGAGNKVATAELFDPATASFSPTGDMETARFNHTATLLRDGKVLLTGGADVMGNALATAELFDPATASFSPTGNMETARFNHTATLLRDGKVLLTGGADVMGTALATAELFDPVTAGFSPTANMETARTGHGAVLLNDGTVLATGGTNGNGAILLDAELFDPATGTFVPTGSMSVARTAHTATLLTNGAVLVTGGISSSGGNPTVTATAELFDPTTGAVVLTGRTESPRELHTATRRTDGKVLVTGGLSGTGDLSTADVRSCDRDFHACWQYGD